MTGTNYRFLERGTEVKRLKEKINALRYKCGELLNVNNVRENGFDDVLYEKLTKQIEWNEYLLWGLTEK